MTTRTDERLRSGSLRGARARPGAAAQGAFTLLELVLAVTILATFILPILGMIAEARVKAIRYTTERQARGLAQSKLHERIHYFEVEDRGTFEKEGFPNWVWEFAPPELRTQGEQVILIYTIRVRIPQKLQDIGTVDDEGTVLEYTTWTFPDARWYEEQQLLFENGQYSELYGWPDGSGGGAASGGLGSSPGGALGGSLSRGTR